MRRFGLKLPEKTNVPATQRPSDPARPSLLCLQGSPILRTRRRTAKPLYCSNGGSLLYSSNPLIGTFYQLVMHESVEEPILV